MGIAQAVAPIEPGPDVATRPTLRAVAPVERRLINEGALRLDEARRDLATRGYTIAHDLVPVEHIQVIRRFWLDRYSRVQGQLPRVTWSPFLGQENTMGFSSDPFQHLYRSTDFLWNDPQETLSREICVRLHALRNEMIGVDPELGLRFSPGRHGLFITTSYYPPIRGFMKVHVDGISKDLPLVHFIVPLTHRGVDYASGGMVVHDRAGKRLEVDSLLRPGSVVFYDGGLQHGVDPIIPLRPPAPAVGRLQMSGFPGLFKNVEADPRALERLSLRFILSAKWALLKRDARLLLGLGPSLR